MEKSLVNLEIAKQLKSKMSLFQHEWVQMKNENSEGVKSSAGDKHEVANEMASFEMDKLAERIMITKQMLSQAEQLPKHASKVVELGALVFTNRGLFHVSLPVGLIKVAGVDVYAISEQSPLALAFKRKSAGNVCVINKIEYLIQNVI